MKLIVVYMWVACVTANNAPVSVDKEVIAIVQKNEVQGVGKHEDGYLLR
jgi:hypothetical protein